VWLNLEKAFQDSGLNRRVGLLRTLITTKLEDSKSVEDHVNRIISTAHKLKGVGMEINDEWIGALMLAGLPESYKPMILGLENSGLPITADSIKIKLLQDVKDVSENKKSVLMTKYSSKSTSQQRKGPRCFECNKHGHFAKDCRNKSKKGGNTDKKQKLITNEEATSSKQSTLMCNTLLLGETGQNEWYINSSASAHMTLCSNWLKDIKKIKNENVTLADKRIPVENQGDVHLDVSVCKSVATVKVKDVLYVPDVATNLLSVSEMTRRGNKVVFDSDGCKIFNDQNRIIATTTIVGNMYRLNRPENRHVAFTKAQKDSNLWHRRLGHISDDNLLRLAKGMASGIDICKIDCERCEISRVNSQDCLLNIQETEPKKFWN